MSHVDKGALHAYLDGALDEYPVAEAERIRDHVDQCVECAIRLEAERRVRLDAQTILGMAAPEVDMPSLEELRAYVKRTREPRPVAVTRIYRMGWAASVLLAVGAGWTMRGGQLQEAGLLSGDFQRPAAEAMAPARSSTSDAPTSSAEVAVAADQTVREEAKSFADAGALARQNELQERDDLPPAVMADRVDAARLAEETVAGAPMPAAPLDAEKIRLSPDEAMGGRSALGNVTSGASGAALDVLVENVAVPPPGILDSVVAGAGDPSAAGGTAAGLDVVAASEPERAERRRGESLVPLTSAMTPSTLSGQRQTDDDEALSNEEPALVVEGYAFVSMVNMGEGTTPVGVHVVQRYTPESTFEVFHLEPGVDIDVLPPARPGDAMVRTATERGWIVVRGPLSQTELQELLDRLFPESGIEESGAQRGAAAAGG